MDNDSKVYCPVCRRFYYGWAKERVCPICRSQLISEEDIADQKRKHYREAIKSESINHN